MLARQRHLSTVLERYDKPHKRPGRKSRRQRPPNDDTPVAALVHRAAPEGGGVINGNTQPR
jgi:hypothetical protein